MYRNNLLQPKLTYNSGQLSSSLSFGLSKILLLVMIKLTMKMISEHATSESRLSKCKLVVEEDFLFSISIRF